MRIYNKISTILYHKDDSVTRLNKVNMKFICIVALFALFCSHIYAQGEEITNMQYKFANDKATIDTTLQKWHERIPPFAVKTNLLYDLLLVPNVEIEVPISRRWSIAGEWMFPWWVTKDNGNALQILSGTLESRYWFGERENRPLLTGWFGGIYFSGGYYDLQRKNNGYQGEFYIAAGLSAGYTHTINKKGNLLMEYNLGVGYLKTDYRYYEGKENNEFLVWQYDGSYTWIGPTKLEVSLVWVFNHNRKIGGGAR